jgi:hypothetical protein
MHHDFKQPSAEARRPSLQPDGLPGMTGPFSSESSMHRDYRAPSMDALLQSGKERHSLQRKAPEVQLTGIYPVPFTGESSTHRDYQAPSLDALLQTWQTAPRRRQPESSTPLLAEALRPAPESPEAPTSTGEANMRVRSADYSALAAQRSYLALAKRRRAQSAERAFEGVSSYRRDYTALGFEAAQAKSRSRRRAGKATTADVHAAAAARPIEDNAKFQGTSTSKHDYKAPSRDALLCAHTSQAGRAKSAERMFWTRDKEEVPSACRRQTRRTKSADGVRSNHLRGAAGDVEATRGARCDPSPNDYDQPENRRTAHFGHSSDFQPPMSSQERRPPT